MKKNALAAALTVGLGLTGAAAAYNYGTLKDPANTGYTDAAESTPTADMIAAEPVAYQNITISSGYDYIMSEQLVWDFNPPDNAVNYTQGFTARMTLQDGALFDTSYTPSVYNSGCNADGIVGNADDTVPTTAYAGQDIRLDPTLTCTWDVAFDNYYDAGQTISIRITPKQGVTNPQNPSSGMLLRYDNAHLTSLDEFVNGPMGNIVHGQFWFINPSNDAPFTGSIQIKDVLQKVSGLEACANSEGAETDKYIDVADSWFESQMPKTRFSFDGKLGSASDANNAGFGAGRGDNSQTIDLGDVTLDNTGAGGFAFLATDTFTTVLTGTGNWLAFENGAGIDDDVYLVNGTCAAGTIVDAGTISGSTVTFNYSAGAAGLPLTTGGSSTPLTVCAFADTNVVIDDQTISVATTFFRAGATTTPTFADPTCELLPLRYNGSTMEIFTINPASNTTQRSFLRLTNRSATDGYVSLEGIDNAGNSGASQVRVFVPAGASVQLDAADLENGANGAQGAWGQGVGKWRAVVTAEFPGLVASSLVNSALPRVLTNITDADTREEQVFSSFYGGAIGTTPGNRPSDFPQEYQPDFRGNGASNTAPGGPDAGWTDQNGNGVYDPGESTPRGGTTDENGNPGL